MSSPPLSSTARSPRRRRGWYVVALGILLGGASLALAAEALLRVYPRGLPEEAQLQLHWRELVDAGMNLEADPFLGFTYPADARGEIRRGAFHFSYATDEHGFRNPSPWPQQADIVLLGDSHGFGYGVDDDAAWPRLIDRALPEHDLINLSMIAASVQQDERVFETFGRQLHPKLTILALFPAFALVAAEDFRSWLAAGQPGSFVDWRFGDRNLFVAVRLLKELTARSYLLLYLRNLARGIIGRSWEGRTITFEDGARLQFAPAVYAGNAARARVDDPDFLAVMDDVERTRRAASDAGSAFLVVLVPTKEQVYLPLLGSEAPDATPAFKSALSERDVEFLDLTPPLQKAARAGERLFFEIDIHPNPLGNRVIAGAILDHLRARAERYGLAGPN